MVERLENRQYLVKYDGSGRILLRTRGHLQKFELCTRSCGLPDVPVEEQEEKVSSSTAEKGVVDRPLLIPGALPAGRVIHPIHDHEGFTGGADIGVRQEGDNLGQQEPARGMVE